MNTQDTARSVALTVRVELRSITYRSLLKTQKASGFANGIDDLHLPKLELVQKLLSRGKSLWFNASPIHQI